MWTRCAAAIVTLSPLAGNDGCRQVVWLFGYQQTTDSGGTSSYDLTDCTRPIELSRIQWTGGHVYLMWERSLKYRWEIEWET